jgi:UPF0176 protein
MNSAANKFETAAFYQFATVQDCEALQQSIRRDCQANGVTGTVLIAPEGINGTICGEPAGVNAVLEQIRSDSRFARLEHKSSFAQQRPLARLKVKIKPEIIALRHPGVDAANNAGTYVEAENWNDLISDPSVVVIDTRNDYEVQIGSFRGAINPNTAHFSELPQWIDQQTDLQSKPRVAMFCTGGIRCEKSTALLKAKGFDEVFHLRGGILKYLETVSEDQSLFDGECFVFDERVSVNHDLARGSFELCRKCGRPVDATDKPEKNFIAQQLCEQCTQSKSESPDG